MEPGTPTGQGEMPGVEGAVGVVGEAERKHPLHLRQGLKGLDQGGAAQAADDFYKDKTVNVIVGFTPGGGYDAYGRQLARFMGDHIPGKPTLIVQNMPGAGSMTAVRALDATQPKDGSVMVIFNPGLIVQSLVQPDKVPVDFRKYAFVGVVTPVGLNEVIKLFNLLLGQLGAAQLSASFECCQCRACIFDFA
jgi:hypothetical protein